MNCDVIGYVSLIDVWWWFTGTPTVSDKIAPPGCSWVYVVGNGIVLRGTYEFDDKSWDT